MTKYPIWFDVYSVKFNSSEIFRQIFVASQKTWTLTGCKVRTFWETQKNWKNLPHGFDKSADLLSKRQNHEEDFFKLWVLLKKSELKLHKYIKLMLVKICTTPFFRGQACKANYLLYKVINDKELEGNCIMVSFFPDLLKLAIYYICLLLIQEALFDM